MPLVKVKKGSGTVWYITKSDAHLVERGKSKRVTAFLSQEKKSYTRCRACELEIVPKEEEE